MGSYEYLLVCAGLDTELQVYYHKIGMLFRTKKNPLLLTLWMENLKLESVALL